MRNQASAFDKEAASARRENKARLVWYAGGVALIGAGISCQAVASMIGIILS